MYCKYCGKEISEDSIYCSQCGKILENTDEIEEKHDSECDNTINSKNAREPSWFECCISPVLIFLAVIIGFAVLIFGILTCVSRGYIPLLHEKADELDIILDAGDVKNIFTDDVVYVIVHSNEKIKDLKIKFYLLDSDGNVLKETTVDIGDIAKNDTYSFKVNDVGLSTSEKRNVAKYKYEIINGYVFK